MSDVIVVGAGVIGLGIAWRCAQRGLDVTVLDPAPGSGASGTAAGMLAPVTELHYGEQALLNLNLDSAARYPAFADELAEATGLSVGYRRTGTISVGWDGADLASLRDLQAFGRTLGLSTELLTSQDLRRLEPALSPGLPGGLLAPDDHQVDSRALHAALLTAAEVAGARIVSQRVAELRYESDRAVGVRLDGGSRLDAPTVVLAAGAWSPAIAGLPSGQVPVRPVKGQTLQVRLDGGPLLTHVVRGTVHGSPVYLVPRDDGRIVIGATSEEAGYDLRPRAGAVYELLRDAQSVLPVLGEAEFLEVSTSVRPATADNAPLIGPSAVDGLILATGHYRNGVLLTPVTADSVAAFVTGEPPPDVVAAFTPARLGTSKVGA
jgi:glycine oxidase